MIKKTTRVNLNMPVDLLTRVDEYSDKLNLNRTATMVVLLTQALDQQKAMLEMSDLLKLTKLQTK